MALIEPHTVVITANAWRPNGRAAACVFVSSSAIESAGTATWPESTAARYALYRTPLPRRTVPLSVSSQVRNRYTSPDLRWAFKTGAPGVGAGTRAGSCSAGFSSAWPHAAPRRQPLNRRTLSTRQVMRGKVKQRSRARPRVEDPLPLPRGHHVPIDHVAHDARDGGVPARLGREPALPLDLVEGRGERLAVEPPRRAPQALCRHAPAQHRGSGEQPLRVRAQTPEAHANRGDDRVGALPRRRLVERLERLGPRAAALLAEVEAPGDRVQQLDRQQRNAGRVGGDPPGDAIELDIAVAWQRPARQGAEGVVA